MKEEFFWAFLPEGLEEYFDIEFFEKDEKCFKITLVEKNILPVEMPAEYHGKKVINTVLNDVQMDDFPIIQSDLRMIHCNPIFNERLGNVIR